MIKIFAKVFAAAALFTVFNAHAQYQNPVCNEVKDLDGSIIQKKVHVWYSLTNREEGLSGKSWFVQISRVYENNIGFVNKYCEIMDINNKIEIAANSTQIVGMVVLTEKSFNSIYSFTGARNDATLPLTPNRKRACIFVVAPYGPGQMDRVDWKLNNADCYATEYGTQMNFK